MQTFSRKSFDFDEREPEVCLEDIARALSLIPRFGGHTAYHYSVAQHSLLVAKEVAARRPDEPGVYAYGLLHDAHEAYVGDIITPLKEYLDTGRLRELTDRIDRAVHALLKPEWTMHAYPGYLGPVRGADLSLLLLEVEVLKGGQAFDWNVYAPMPIAVTRHDLRERDWREVEQEFLHEVKRCCR
jgi:hypothetical protein